MSDDVKLCFCNNCKSIILFINDLEMELLNSFNEKNVIKRQKDDLTILFPSVYSKSEAVKNILNEYDKSYRNLIAAKVIEVELGNPYCFRHYHEKGRITDIYQKKYNFCTNTELIKNVDNNMLYYLEKDNRNFCPLCSSDKIEQITIPALSLEYDYPPKRKEELEKIHREFEDILEKISQYAQNKKEEFICNNKNVTENEVYDSSKVDVKELLLNLINTEKNINFLEEELEILIRKEIKQKKLISSIVYAIKNKKSNFDLEVIKKPEEPEKPEEPILKKVGFFTKHNDNTYNQKLIEEYNLKMQKYEENMKQYLENIELYENKVEQQNKQIEKIKNELNGNIKRVLDFKNDKNILDLDIISNVSDTDKKRFDLAKNGYIFIEENIDEVEKNLVELYKLKNNLLSLNIIFPKYNNLVAWSTIYEYYITGRVQDLTGPNGAYNLYENEVRSNLIISKLDNISDKLDTIKDNQYTLYTVMTDIKNDLSSLNKKMDEELTLSTITAFNSSKMAYYTKIISEKASAIAWLTLLK